MKSIDNIDKNFHVDNEIKKEDLSFYDSTEQPFKIYGLLKPTEGVRTYSWTPKGVKIYVYKRTKGTCIKRI